MVARRLAMVAGLVVVTLACGCTSAGDFSRRMPVESLARKVPPNAEYVVDPPDAVMIEFPDDPDLSRSATLRSDGVITLRLVGDVHVARLTTEQIRQKLEGLYAKYYKDPRVIVSVTAYRSKYYYLYGEVVQPGPRPYRGYETVRDAIGAAGGVTRRAAWTRARVIRGDLEEPEVYGVNLKKLIRGGDTSRDILLAENDVIYVPPTVLATIGYQIQNLLFPARPAAALAATPATFSSGGGTSSQYR